MRHYLANGWQAWQDSPAYGCDDNPSYKWYAHRYQANGHWTGEARGPCETLEEIQALCA